MAERQFFVTGATGHLGTELVRHLVLTTDATIHVLVRASHTSEATHKLISLWCDDEALRSAVGSRVVPVIGDITLERIISDDNALTHITNNTTHLIHCAAETGVQKSKGELWRINVNGTRNVLRFAEKIRCLHRFTYVSTAYVAGTNAGVITEDSPTAEHFYSLYEQSKAEAEQLVRSSGLPFTICRPGMIVGNSITGRTRNFNTVYYVLKLLLLRKLRFLPISCYQRVNVVPVDYVASKVATLTLEPQSEGKTFHLTAPTTQLPMAGELVDEVRSWAKSNLHITIPRPIYLPMPLLRTIGKHYNSGTDAKSRNILSNLMALMPYFMDDHEFDRTNTDQVTGKYDMDWHSYLPSLLDYACSHNFMRRNGQSIFEQAVSRRKSQHYPITYYNISADKTERVTSKEMNTMVMHYQKILESYGVGIGERVALSGINCVEYAAIDNAIGLIGATSVPIYYTSPAEEILMLLENSGSRLFFVGDERISQNLANVSCDTKIIYFGPLQKEVNKSDTVSPPSTPTFDQTTSVATIRYTSGTTGIPKGVMFNFNQLKWMGESLGNLLSWKDRTKEMRYLSFLPLSHVVEGILAAYVPYCILCKTKIYYLNDFQMLQQALPKVRPTVFFSVPRFYEKLMEQAEQNPMVKHYLKMKNGRIKSLLGKILSHVILRKAGLDKCSHLIVGSAPVSEELLLRFRNLGIEIHNAYGQTEAPLISINQLGDNTIPSVGKPLRETSVELASDGELIVKGPQVADGYYGIKSDTFAEGKLHTGDLCQKDDKGHLYIVGRKRDIQITSYGKNINSSKIEQKLKDIQGVEHAVLIGEGRPYCAALLWVSSGEDTLDEKIKQVNKILSHPEQVKRWLVIKKPLGIKSGELTPNLKVKRDVVLQHFKKEIGMLYESN